MKRADSMGKTMMLGKIEGRRRRGQQSTSWLDGITDSMSTSLSKAPGDNEGQGRSAGEGIGYPLQYSWVSLVAQLVKNPPAIMQETWIQSLGWEDPPENRKATHSSILAWRISWTM